MNVITFIIRVLKLLFMQGKYILSAFVVILLVCSPVAAGTNKIAAGAPVFIGESNLNIASATGDCHVIAWWPDEGNMTGPATKNLTIKRLNEANDLITHFNISPGVFGDYTGNWYCEDKAPKFVVLTVYEPQISLQVWDIDNDTDVSGQVLPYSANVTYRVVTNLNQALNYYNRTELTPADGFFTVTLTGPGGKQISNIYTGSVGGATTQILQFDNNPFITTSPYLGRNMHDWNHLARGATGDLIYPAGTYTFAVTQNLNHMQESYATSGIDLNGRTTASASVAFLPREALTATATPASVTEEVTPVSETSPVPESSAMTTVPTTEPVARKTTYSPLPGWIVVAGLVLAVFLVARKTR
jgi:hypothetical protein